MEGANSARVDPGRTRALKVVKSRGRAHGAACHHSAPDGERGCERTAPRCRPGTAAATWRSAGQGLFYGTRLAVSVAKAVTLGTNALSRAGGSAVLAREGLAPGVSLW